MTKLLLHWWWIGKEKLACSSSKKSPSCWCSVFLVRSPLSSSERPVFRLPPAQDLSWHQSSNHRPGDWALFILCQYVRYDPRARMQTRTHTHTYTHTHINSQPRLLNHHPALFKMNVWYLAFHYSHLCFSLSAVWCLISVSLCFVWYGAAPMHFYSLSHIAFLFKAMCVRVCVCVCVRTSVFCSANLDRKCVRVCVSVWALCGSVCSREVAAFLQSKSSH